MIVTVYSFITSLLWFDLFAVLIYFFTRRMSFVKYFSVYPLIFMILLSMTRMFIYFEFPFTRVIHSDVVYPTLVKAVRMKVFSIDGLTYAMLLCIIWSIVSICLFIRFLLQEIKFSRHLLHEPQTDDKRIIAVMNEVMDKKQREVKIIVTSSIDYPIITGLIKPVILLPDIEFSDSDLYNVLSHEWFHYIHRDLWAKLLVEIISIIYWWNPVIYLLKRDIDYSFEIKSDLSVTGTMCEKGKIDYLKTILYVIKTIHNKKESSSAFLKIGLLPDKKRNQVIKRFELVLNDRETSGRVGRFMVYAMSIVFFVCTYLFVLQPEFKPPAESEDGYIVFDLDENSTYILESSDGTFSLYVGDEYICEVDDITLKPFNEMNIKLWNED